MTTYYFFRIGLVVLPHLPPALVFWLCQVVADLAFALSPRLRRNVGANVRRVLPDASEARRRQVARGIVRNNIKNYYDILRLNWMPTRAIDRETDMHGVEYLRAASRYGKGVVMVAAHTGSFSFVDQVSERVGVHFNLLVEPIQPPKLYDLVSKLRASSTNTSMIPIGGAGLRNIFRALKQNQLVCFACDRDVSGTGAPLPFFGEIASIPTGAAEVALRTGAVVVPVSVSRATDHAQVLLMWPGYLITKGGVVALSDIERGQPLPAATLDNEAAVREGTLAIIASMEAIIRAHPDQWVVLQPIWPV